MAFQNPGFLFNRASILQHAPSASGVYGLWTATSWIYVGESNDIQRRLLEHFNGDNVLITRAAPTSFGFELSGAFQRVARQNALILELRPFCNQILG
jgi:predicted GIY-YIG superfamily endonuclease